MKKIFSANKIFILALAVLFAQNTIWSQPLQPGRWHASIFRADDQQIVFNFDVKDSSGRKLMYIINADERLLVDDITYHGDSVFIRMPFFGSSFRTRLNSQGVLDGVWVKDYGNRTQTLPFKATPYQKDRFLVVKNPGFDISGRWEADFTDQKQGTTRRIGEFQQKGSYLTGTILDPTGDWRFLEGVVSGDSLKLSAFDGSHAMLFTAKIKNGNTISGGRLYSGTRGYAEWTATKNDSAVFADEYSLTGVIPEAGKLSFMFPEMTDGRMVSISDSRFKGKVTVITIMGSWCPNCMDEAQFLSGYYKKNHDKGLEVIALAYEYTEDFKTSQRSLQSFKDRFDITYPVLITGVTVYDSLRTEKTLPQLTGIHAFPTTLFVDRKGNIRKVHSGFDGPATGEHYDRFKKEFDRIVNELLDEDN